MAKAKSELQCLIGTDGRISIPGAHPSLAVAGKSNIKVRPMLIAEDKVKICLMNHIRYLDRRAGWQAPAASASSLGLALVTSKFNAALGMSAEFYHAAFWILFFLSLGWLVVDLKQRPSAMTIRDIMDELWSEESDAGGDSVL